MLEDIQWPVRASNEPRREHDVIRMTLSTYTRLFSHSPTLAPVSSAPKGKLYIGSSDYDKNKNKIIILP